MFEKQKVKLHIKYKHLFNLFRYETAGHRTCPTLRAVFISYMKLNFTKQIVMLEFHLQSEAIVKVKILNNRG